MQDGTVAVEAGEQEVTLETGDALSFPGDIPHAYVSVGPLPARFVLSVFEPAVGSTYRKGTSHA